MYLLLFQLVSSALWLDEPEPISATPAAEPPVRKPEAESAQLLPPGNEDVTLPDPRPPEPQQIESSSGGGEQVEATDAAPTECIGKCLTPCS
jgi:hypothetical protein